MQPTDLPKTDEAPRACLRFNPQTDAYACADTESEPRFWCENCQSRRENRLRERAESEALAFAHLADAAREALARLVLLSSAMHRDLRNAKPTSALDDGLGRDAAFRLRQSLSQSCVLLGVDAETGDRLPDAAFTPFRVTAPTALSAEALDAICTEELRELRGESGHCVACGAEPKSMYRIGFGQLSCEECGDVTSDS